MIQDIDAAIANRATVRIRIMPGCGRPSLVGAVGMAMGYNAQYHTVKFGFIDANGKYTGEKTVIGFNYVELIEEAPETKEPMTDSLGFPLSDSITPEVIEALATLREFARNSSLTELDEALAIDILDNAGTFAAIDEATGYDIEVSGFCNCDDPSTSPCIVKGHPVKVSKCTCPPKLVMREGHLEHCPGDPAEWGDMARTVAADNIRRTIGLKF